MMNSKIYRRLATLTVALGLASAVGCNDFLDVQPKGQQTENLQFSTVQGYYDAMYGVYGLMATTDLYGGYLSVSLVEQLGQMMGRNQEAQVDFRALRYEYNHEDVRRLYTTLWTTQYKAINELNNVLLHLSGRGDREGALTLVEGEAYGLRAFLHFDLLRLFAVDYRQNASAVGLPYADTYNLANKTVYNVGDTYQRILEDLDRAEALLADNRELTYNASTRRYDIGRAIHFNIYAVWATKARVYLTMGDYENAARYARMVVGESSVLSLATAGQVESVMRFPAGMTAGTGGVSTGREMIFGLYTRALNEPFARLFYSEDQVRGTFVEGRQGLASLYETNTFTTGNTDVRYSAYYNFSFTPSATIKRFLASAAEAEQSALRGLTLIRLPEMHYILAEALYDSNRAEALRYLNAVRQSRGLRALTEQDDADKLGTRTLFEQELMREIMREMLGEGQVFFALKHYNRDFTSIDGSSIISASREVFVVPRPTQELDFGNNQNEN